MKKAPSGAFFLTFSVHKKRNTIVKMLRVLHSQSLRGAAQGWSKD
jgi:hypothetical protein